MLVEQANQLRNLHLANAALPNIVIRLLQSLYVKGYQFLYCFIRNFLISSKDQSEQQSVNVVEG